MNVEELQTGDLILVCNTETGWFNYFLDVIKYSTHSNYVHIGMIVKDPDFLEYPMKGTYIWESSYEGTPDPEDGKIKLGVQLTKIETFIQNYKKESTSFKLLVRKIKDNSKKIFDNSVMNKVHSIVTDKPYDINIKDWIMAFFRKADEPQNTKSFWCSALVGYIYTQCGILSKDTDWNVLYPNDFSLDGEKLNYKNKDKNFLLPFEKELVIDNIN